MLDDFAHLSVRLSNSFWKEAIHNVSVYQLSLYYQL